jgi:hypothetical protein
MATQLARDIVTGPLGTFRVSTIQTDAGGGKKFRPSFAPFSSSDYVSETPWPFETMIFRSDSSTGLYHAPYSTKAEAKRGHAQMVEAIKQGIEFGGGVEGVFGTPSMTAAQWEERTKAVQR